MYGTDYHTCAMKMECSEECVRAYLKRYAEKCTRGRTPTCEDYSRVHNGGPEGCENSDTLSYWQRVMRCCGEDCSSSSSASLLAHASYKKASISFYMLMKILKRNWQRHCYTSDSLDNIHHWRITNLGVFLANIIIVHFMWPFHGDRFQRERLGSGNGISTVILTVGTCVPGNIPGTYRCGHIHIWFRNTIIVR